MTLSRNDYEVIKMIAADSSVEECRMEIVNRLVEGGMAYENARALIALFQVLAIEAGVAP